MYVARILTNETCNQNCAFCTARRPVERVSVARFEAVAERIVAAVAAGARELVLTGGEPTLRRDLPSLVALARRAGAERVTLETNAALIDEPRAQALRTAGLDLARVHLPAWGEAADAITRDAGGFAATLRGLAALDGAGIALEASAPVVRANLAALPSLPRALATSGFRIRALVLSVPVTAPDTSTLVPLPAAAEVIDAVEQAAREVRLRLRLDAGAPVPPCLFPRPARVAHLYSFTAGGADRPDHAHPAACASCAVHDRCPGLPLEALARTPDLASALRPISDDKTRRRLSVISSVDDQIARELITRDERRTDDGRVIPEMILRVNFHCNQACTFCFVSTHLPPAEEGAIEAAIDEIGARQGVLTLSGGEPTLNPRLVEYVRRARARGVRGIELQTNAIRLADAALTGALAEAGVDTLLISLHGLTAATSDFVTVAPGTFDKTVAGIDEVARTRMTIRLNFVFCEANHREFPAYVEMVAERWPRASITVSFVAPSTDMVPRLRSLVPRYSEVMPHLAEGIRTARRKGIELTGFESMCGIPICLVPDDISAYFRLAELSPGVDRGEFVKTEACHRCDLQSRCYGIRRGYVEMHGAEELQPIAAKEWRRDGLLPG